MNTEAAIRTALSSDSWPGTTGLASFVIVLVSLAAGAAAWLWAQDARHAVEETNSVNGYLSAFEGRVAEALGR